MTQGWIKLHRGFTKFEWYQDANTMRLFLHLLIMANHKKAKWQGNVIERGQLITSRGHLSRDLGMTVQVVRTSLAKLEKTENITIKTTSKFTMLSICNYDTYQSEGGENNQRLNQQITIKQPALNHQLTINKNDKNKKEEKEEGGEFVFFGIDVRTLNQKTQRGKQRTLEELKQVAQFKSQGYPVD
jgi:transcription initiation factor IIE alpha subunit